LLQQTSASNNKLERPLHQQSITITPNQQ